MKRIGLLPLARPTFDVPFAEANLAAMLSVLDELDAEISGSKTLLMDAPSTEAAVNDLLNNDIDILLVLQVTFTDASAIVDTVNRIEKPVVVWAIPEPRMGGRLRLNSFCGLNLASHALGLNDRPMHWLYRDPASADVLQKLRSVLLDIDQVNRRPEHHKSTGVSEKAIDAVESLKTKRIARIGDAPDGFHTCRYDKKALGGLTGTQVEEIELSELFDLAAQSEDKETSEVSKTVHSLIDNAPSLDPDQLDRSMRLKVALDKIRQSGEFDAFAIRCWPETFTEYGGAVCGPVSMMGEARVPCACEADVYGALSQLLLQEISNQAVFLVDVVDMDVSDDTGVVWHCGQAPFSMASNANSIEGTIHTNRKMPLLFEFALKSGRVTFVRISQSLGEPKLVIATGEMLERPMAFTGTSGVVRFDNGTEATLNDLINSGLEHHMALTYGDYKDDLLAAANALELPTLELGER